MLIEARQTAGDWSDAPTPDLTINWLVSKTVGLVGDLGGGKFSCRARSGDAAVIAPGAGSFLHLDDQHVVRALAVPYAPLLRLTGEEPGLPRDGDFGPLHVALLRDAELSRTLDVLWRETHGVEGHSALLIDGLLLQLVGYLLRLRGSAQGRRRSSGGLSPRHLRQVTQLLEERLAQDVRLEELADLTGLSTFHLCRAFKRSTGLPPHRWRLARRIERARDILENTDLPVTEVAAAVGYDDPSQLASTFRKALGISPSQYRRERRL